MAHKIKNVSGGKYVTTVILNDIIQKQPTTRTTDFFVVGKMSGILVRFVILVGAPIETMRLWYVAHIGKGFFVFYSTNQTTVKQSDFIDEYWKKPLFQAFPPIFAKLKVFFLNSNFLC